MRFVGGQRWISGWWRDPGEEEEGCGTTEALGLRWGKTWQVDFTGCTLPSSSTGSAPPDLELCCQNRGGTPPSPSSWCVMAIHQSSLSTCYLHEEISWQASRLVERGEQGGGWVVVFVVSSGDWVVGFMCLGQLWRDGPRDGLDGSSDGTPSSVLPLFFLSFQPFICWLIYTKCTV
jgi:hypothetical protein